MTSKVFVSTKNKDIIRSTYDKQIIQEFGSNLTYFGLPGPEILDILEWRSCIKYVVAVERDETLAQLLLDNIFRAKIKLDGFQLLHGDVDDILTSGFDKYGTSIKFPFNLVNLDYYGGVIYTDLKGKSKRAEAIRKLFERQRQGGKSFLLFFTFNSRNRDEKEFEHTIDALEECLHGMQIQATDLFEWYREKPGKYPYKIKIFVLHFICSLASAHQFEYHCYPPIVYIGEKAKMLHFAFKLNWIPTIGGPAYNPITTLNCPLKQLKNGHFVDLGIPTLRVKEAST